MDDKQKSSVQSSCFKHTKIGDTDWLVKSTFTNEFYEVMFCDFSSIWQEHLSSSDIIIRAKVINSNFEIDFLKLLEHISNGLDGSHPGVTYFATLSSSSQQLTVTMKLKLAGLPFEWLFNATRQPADLVREQVTWPLMAMVVELNRQKKELFNRLKRKDQEIADFRCQGAKCRKKLETPIFDETAFNRDMLHSTDFVNNVRQKVPNVFDHDGRELYGEVMRKMEVPSVTDSEILDHMLSVTDTGTASCSPTQSPIKSSEKPATEQIKETELQRRLELEQKLAEEERKTSITKKRKLKL